METKFRNMALLLIKDNFSPFEFAEFFRLTSLMLVPSLEVLNLFLSLAFKVLDYLGARCVIFRPQ